MEDGEGGDRGGGREVNGEGEEKKERGKRLCRGNEMERERSIHNKSTDEERQ